jgi:carbamoyl-phosphate synthase large subunit
MKILISSIGRRGYLAREFKKHDVQVVGTSNSDWTVGFNGCDEKIIMPNINSSEYLPFLLKVCKEKKISAIFSVFDMDIDKLTMYKKEFENNNIVAFLPSKEISEICFDKLKTYEFLIENNLKTFLTFDEIDAALSAISQNRLNYPLMVKPKKGFGSSSLFVARNQKELEVFFNYNEDMIIQEMSSGTEYSFDILYSLESEVIDVYCKKKIQMRSGETDKAIMVNDKQLIEFGLNFGKFFKNIGPMDVDFFIEKNGDIKILEINPRFGGGYPISHKAGANFPKKMIEMINGKKYHFEYPTYGSNIIMMKDINFYFETIKQVKK